MKNTAGVLGLLGLCFVAHPTLADDTSQRATMMSIYTIGTATYILESTCREHIRRQPQFAEQMIAVNQVIAKNLSEELINAAADTGESLYRKAFPLGTEVNQENCVNAAFVLEGAFDYDYFIQ